MEIVLIAFVAVAAFFFGMMAEAVAWRSDCKYLQKHFSDGKVFACRLVDTQ